MVDLKLNIGSGGRKMAGFTNIDIEPVYKPDVVGDFRTMSYSDVEVINASHILEHFSRLEAVEVLKQWKSWLKLGGRLIVETPDFEAICAEFATGNRLFLCMIAYGSQEYGWAYHKDGWWEDKYRNILKQLGFSRVFVRKFRRRAKGVFYPCIEVTAYV